MCWVCGHCIPIAPKWGLLLLLWVCLLIKYLSSSRLYTLADSLTCRLLFEVALFMGVDTSSLFYRCC